MSTKISFKYPLIILAFLLSSLLIQLLSFQNSVPANLTFIFLIGVLIYFGKKFKLHLKEN
ncbi:hypothetical protein AM592_19360 [Bacillus gobiensis]|uniref:Uncharacterized protein n=2 Tax=Bacillus TaxID=1386 RepID=A0A0M4FX38_9BACI|nr:hypothetical protein AM592_19360 [Bacillus gobiensis]MBP1082409.1 hypothetical protein [Bacillus capparidis]